MKEGLCRNCSKIISEYPCKYCKWGSHITDAGKMEGYLKEFL